MNLAAYGEPDVAALAAAYGFGLMRTGLAPCRTDRSDQTICRPVRAARKGSQKPSRMVRNHAFVDGNKRIGLVALELFLALNGHELVADDADCVLTILSLAAGTLDEDALADWVRGHVRPV
ncbi:MAG: type II toxin-antitoxin system death-on-curing family toxin [Deltaproteobacteria bacterium]|nr:type II toxin-antitoxin system death-on-curing family toxin [Deltaproteobacteria bacterium]